MGHIYNPFSRGHGEYSWSQRRLPIAGAPHACAAAAASNACAITHAQARPTKPLHVAGDLTTPEREVGALGNVEADASGTAVIDISDRQVRLIGPLSVIGRGVVLRAHADDGGRGPGPSSTVDGNAGGAVATAVIGLANPPLG